MLTREAQLKGNKIATQKLKEKAISSVGEEAIKAILEWRNDGITLREIANRLNNHGYTTMKGKPFQQAQIKRTLDRIKQMDIRISESVTKHTESVTTVLDKMTGLELELDKYKARIEALQAENEKLQQVDIEEEITHRKLSELKKVLEPYQQLLQENVNPNQPRLKKMGELLAAIEKHLV